MKICFLAGANSVHSHRWIKYFINKGHEIHWISLMPSIELLSQTISFYDIGPLSTNPVNIFIQAFKARRLIQKIKPDILHIHSAGTYGFVGVLTGFHPLVITAWGSDVLLNKGFKKELVKFVLKKADVLTCDGDNTTQTMINLGVAPQKIKRINFGVDVEKFKPTPPNNNLKKELFNLDSPIIISLRSLEPVYNIESLIKAIPIIIREVSEAKFVIAGDGSQKKYLQELTGSLNILEKIRFVGTIPSNKLQEYFNISDVYVSTSLSDSGLAASTAEAMACGLPVIITDSGDNRKWVKNGEGGFIVSIKNPEMLAEKIIYLLKDKEMKERAIKSNRKIIEERNNYYVEMEKMEEVYRALNK